MHPFHAVSKTVLDPAVKDNAFIYRRGDAPAASGASFMWDDDWAVIADQRGPQVAVQFHPCKRARKPGPPPPVAAPERELEPA